MSKDEPANGRRQECHLPLTHMMQRQIAARHVTPFDTPAIRATGRCAMAILPLTAALIAAGLGGLSMSTPGHRGGRLFGAWEAPRDPKPR